MGFRDALSSYPRKTWTTWALTPLWVIQMLLYTNSIITVGLLIFEVEGEGGNSAEGWIVCLAFMFIMLLCTAGEIAFWFSRCLHPWTYLGIQIFKTLFWLIYIAAAMALTVARRAMESDILWTVWRYWQAVGTSLSFLATLGALIYASVVVHRYRKAGGNYGAEEKQMDLESDSDISTAPTVVPGRD